MEYRALRPCPTFAFQEFAQCGPPTPPLKKTNLIYQYQCLHGDCEHRNNIHIGMTTTTLLRRLIMHLASGGPKQHALANHNLPLTRADLVNDTKNIIN